MDEAYENYALSANSAATGLATFRAIVKKYRGQDPKKILLDLATASGEPGRWFAAAKDAGLLDLALEFAKKGRTDPRTLSRASRDFIEKDTRFSLQVGQLAIQRILEGHGYELTGIDLLDAYGHFIVAAQALGIEEEARAAVIDMAAKQSNGAFSDILIRQCRTASGAYDPPAAAKVTERRTWTRRSPMRR